MRRAAPCVAALLISLGLVALLFPFARESSLELFLFGSRLRILRPAALYFLALLPLVPLVRVWSRVRRAPLVEALSNFVRALIFACLIVAGAEPSYSRDHARKSVVFALDVSTSSTGSREAMREYLRRARSASGDSEIAAIRFGREARRASLEDLDAATTDAIGDVGSETNIANAIRRALASIDPERVGRIVVLSDGIETRGDARFAASMARSNGITVDTVLFDAGAPDDIALRALSLPDPIEVGAPFEVAITLHATRPRKVRVELRAGLHPNALEPSREVELEAGDTELRFRSIVRTPGIIEYSAGLNGSSPDAIPENDSMSVVARVPGRPVILLAEGVAGRESHLARALGAAEFEVEVRSPRALPTRLEEYGRFAFVILSDAPADDISRPQMEALEAFVRRGGGLLASGGDRAFGLGGWEGTVLERLMPVHMEPTRRSDSPSVALSLILDRSGSMQGPKLELAKEAARAAAGLLGSSDMIEVIGFDAMPERVVRMQSAGNRLAILRDIGTLAGAGGTSIFPAIDLAYQDLLGSRAALRHAILLTDGQSQEEGILELVQLMRADGITISTVGLGSDVNRTLLASVASRGGGRSYFTNDPTQVPRIFLRETTTAAQSGVVEDPFVPRVMRNASFLRGIDLEAAPLLRGYVATRAKASPAEVVLASPNGEPILARWRVGEGWSLAWTSDLKSRWAADWIAWPGFSKFVAQLVREHLHRDTATRLPIYVRLADDSLDVEIDALDEDDSFLHDLESRVRLLKPNGDELAQALATSSAPGRYEAKLPFREYGSFLVEVEHRRKGRAFAHSHATVVRAYPGEFARTEADRDALERIARAGGGRALESSRPELAFRDDGRVVRVDAPAFHVPLLVALALLLADVALRRLTKELRPA